MGRLTDIGTEHGTDKAEHHQFTEFYEEYFEKFSEPNILEIGVLDGASLKTYDEYFFHKAFIVGVDINDKKHLKQPTIGIIQADILSEQAVKACKEILPKDNLYDIIIDDGGHYMEQQQLTLYNLWDLLKPGGIFIIEDLHTSGLSDYNPHNTATTLDVLTGMRDNTYKASQYLSIIQQQAIVEQVDNIKIWSKERSNVHGHTLQPSITSVIVKKGKNANYRTLEDNRDDMTVINQITNSQKELAGESTEVKMIPKKEVTVYEPVLLDEAIDVSQNDIEEDFNQTEISEKEIPEIEFDPSTAKYVTVQEHSLQEIIDGNPIDSITKMQKELEVFYQKLEQLKKHISPK